jgi:hypothetical protein
MEINAQLIKKGNLIDYVVIPYKDYLEIKEKINDYEDIQELRKAKAEDYFKEGKTASLLLNEFKNC